MLQCRCQLLFMTTILIIGLGNPGREFSRTRHNLGFQVLDYFQKRKNFRRFELKKRVHSLISENLLLGKKIILAKPQTFMNNSGQAVKLLLRKFQPDQIWIIQDDLDLPLGKIKISSNKGAGGHHGIESIIQEIKTNDFSRFRLGIKTKHSSSSKIFVVQKFKLREKLAVPKMIQEAVLAIDLAITENLTTAIQKYNQKNSS